MKPKGEKMKNIFVVLITAGVIFSGCEPLSKVTTTMEQNKGVSCEDKDALGVLKRIVDKKFNGDFEIEKDNIVVWDYNNVGRYTCRAKIKKVGESKQQEKKESDSELAGLLAMSQLFAPAQYGISEKGGWVNYYTYETTQGSLYVEIYTQTSTE